MEKEERLTNLQIILKRSQYLITWVPVRASASIASPQPSESLIYNSYGHTLHLNHLTYPLIQPISCVYAIYCLIFCCSLIQSTFSMCMSLPDHNHCVSHTDVICSTSHYVHAYMIVLSVSHWTYNKMISTSCISGRSLQGGGIGFYELAEQVSVRWWQGLQKYIHVCEGVLSK